MAVFQYETTIAAAPERVFDFLARPANLPLVSSPSPRLEVIEAPERLALGSRFVVRVSRFGIGRRVVGVVTWFEEGRGFTDEQTEGPFRHWSHTHTVQAVGGTTLMCDRIEFLAPGGCLGLVLTERRVVRLLGRQFEYRAGRFGRLDRVLIL